MGDAGMHRDAAGTWKDSESFSDSRAVGEVRHTGPAVVRQRRNTPADWRMDGRRCSSPVDRCRFQEWTGSHVCRRARSSAVNRCRFPSDASVRCLKSGGGEEATKKVSKGQQQDETRPERNERWRGRERKSLRTSCAWGGGVGEGEERARRPPMPSTHSSSSAANTALPPAVSSADAWPPTAGTPRPGSSP